MKALITSLLLTLMPPLAFAAGTIKVYSPDSTQPKTLTDAPFLIDLVGQPRLANSWWPGAVISEGKATVIAEQRHQALLARLGALASEEEGDDAAAINSVRRQLQAVKVTGRQLVPLDPDRVRVEPTANRPLEGEYTLWVGPQPAKVMVAGLISSPGKKPFQPGRDVAGYLNDMSLLSGAERSYAWVIYPDGRTENVPVAYWNRRHVEPMPGSVILVGFADSIWSSQYEEINADILYSLTHRIPD